MIIAIASAENAVDRISPESVAVLFRGITMKNAHEMENRERIPANIYM